MKLRKWLQRRWQILTGEEDTPFDEDIPAWLLSVALHLGLLALLAVFLRDHPREERPIELVTTIVEADNEEPPRDFFFSELEKEEIGANSISGVDMAEAAAELEQEVTELTASEELVDPTDVEFGEIAFDDIVDVSMAIESDPNLVIQGVAGIGTSGAAGAIDRITQEIIDSLEDRKTLVVWLFDQSASLSGQRDTIQKRLGRIYEELAYIESIGDMRFARHHDKPLLSAVVAFGQEITERTPQPTDEVSELQQAVAGIENDSSGIERVFQAVYQAADAYKKYARGPDRRNLMFVLFTDEAGDDGAEMLDQAVEICRRHRMRVYVIGVPAPFGREQVEVKWVDPDPQFDQTPQWAPVRHGPESFLPERVKLALPGQTRQEEPLDSGFGPFALTRLAVETSGIYFSVHSNRNSDRPVRRGETSHLSSYIKYFFEPEVMRRYRPDYVSAAEYRNLLKKNAAKRALVRAAAFSWTQPMKEPRTKFPKRNEAALVGLLGEAQQDSAKILAGTLMRMVVELKRGEKDRDKIRRPRWQAGYDLAMGRTLAAKVRAQGYNLMLARARRGMKFQDPASDTWLIRPSREILSGTAMEKEASKAVAYLQRVVEEHEGTPWAMIASRELASPLGWKWTEIFTNVNPPPQPPLPQNNVRPLPRDDTRVFIERKQKRSPPRL